MNPAPELVARDHRRSRLVEAIHRPGGPACMRPLVAGLLIALLTGTGVAAPGLADRLQPSSSTPSR